MLAVPPAGCRGTWPIPVNDRRERIGVRGPLSGHDGLLMGWAGTLRAVRGTMSALILWAWASSCSRVLVSLRDRPYGPLYVSAADTPTPLHHTKPQPSPAPDPPSPQHAHRSSWLASSGWCWTSAAASGMGSTGW